MYWLGSTPALAALALTVVVIFAWRLPGGPSGYVKDVTAGVFALLYLPFLASFVAAMLAPADGPRRVLTFVILTVCSDIGGYFAGITLGRGGRHLMAPVISPKKTWEGFAGSAVACLVAGWLCVTLMLHGHAWQGLLTGAAAVLAAILGDLVESVIKRDLDIKDMGTLLPGHGGVLERLDSLLVVAPVSGCCSTCSFPRVSLSPAIQLRCWAASLLTRLADPCSLASWRSRSKIGTIHSHRTGSPPKVKPDRSGGSGPGSEPGESSSSTAP